MKIITIQLGLSEYYFPLKCFGDVGILIDMAGAPGELFPLSSNQKNIWDLERTFSGKSINSISSTIRFKGKIDFLLMEKALNQVLLNDISLRTQLTIKEGGPCQYHVPYKESRFPLIDLSMADEDGIKSWEEAVTREALNFYDSPLYRFILMKIRDDTAGILVITHHIISDGWTQVSLCNRIGRAYIDLAAGRKSEAETLPSYALFVEEERRYLMSAACERDEEYWKGITGKESEPVSLKSARGSFISPVGKQRSFELPEWLNDAVYSYCSQNRIAPFLVFYMALAAYLKRRGAGDRFTVGVPVFNRSNHIFRKTTGMFVSTVPFCTEISEEWSFDEFRERLAESWLELLRHQRFPLERIRALSNSETPLFNIMLSYQDSKVLKSDCERIDFSGVWHYGGYQAEQLCIHIMNLEDNRRYSVNYEYLVQFFHDSEIERLHSSICHILGAALRSPMKPLAELPITAPEEHRRVVYDFNGTNKPFSYVNPYEMLVSNSLEHPDRPALIYKGDTISYAELIRRAGRVAAALGADGGLFATLLPRSPELYSAIAGIMQAGAAWLIISPDTPYGRILEILNQSGANALISERDVIECIDGLSGLSLPLIDMGALPPATDTVIPSEPEGLAYVVYTSGSTGRPKGVEITRKNLLNFSLGAAPLFPDSPILSLCSIGFDAFILESAAAMLCGKTVVLPDDSDQEDPARLAALIKRYSVGFMAITPSRLAAYLRNRAFADSLLGVRSIICGGEAFPQELLRNILQFTKADIYNQYGPSETTVGVSYARLNDARAITVGRPMDNCRLYVLDEKLNPLPVGVYGELYVGGMCVGRGYRGEPSLTAQSFLNSPFEPGERLYKTGDIAAWTEDGEIVISGRRDRQLKLRGLRIEPQEISECLSKHPFVTDAAVRVVSKNDQQLLIAYCVTSRPVAETELLAYAASYLPRYMIPARVMLIDAIPLTPNGKTDEAALPEPSDEEAVSCASTPLQEQLLLTFRSVLENPGIHAGSDYFLCGGNSLNALEAIGEIEEKTGIRLRVSDLYACRTVRRLGEYLSGLCPESPSGPKPRYALPELKKYEPTDMQKNVYVQSFMDPTKIAYNMPGAFRLGFKPDIERLESAFSALIEGDDNFRTSFVREGASIAAVISDSAEFRLELLGGSREEVFSEFVRPFELSKAPLIRAALWEDEYGGWFMLIDCHHIICDGVSTPLILERLNRIYMGEACSVPLTYKHYAFYQRNDGESNKTAEEYWLGVLQPLPEPLDIPLDSARPAVFDYNGSHLSFSVNQGIAARIDAFCEKHGLTPYMFMLGAFGILVSKASRQRDLVVGIPVSARNRPELLKVCGIFINTLPVRLRPEGDILAYLEGVREAVVGALDHPVLPLDSIISRLNIQRSLSRNPLYQILFSMRPLDAGSFTFGGERLEYIPVPTRTSKLDLSFEAAREGEGYTIFAEYCASLFSEETIRLYGRTFISIIEEMLVGEALSVEDISALSAEDKKRFIYGPGSVSVAFDDMPINRIIKSTALENPDKTAVIWHDEKTTYRELDERSDAVAALLISKGVVRGDRVGLSCMRTPDLLASMLGILKAGAAYVPFLTDYPAERIKYMLATAGARLLLSDESCRNALPSELSCPVATLSQCEGAEAPECYQETADPMYVLFTSGSTGQPKGVQVPHRAIANLLGSVRELMRPHKGPVLCTTNVTFDIFVTESLLALAQGLCVVLADEEEMMLPWKTAELIRKHHTTIAQFTPSRLQMCLSNDAFAAAADNIEFVILVGEAVTPQLVEKFKKHSRGRFVNMYGPTEAAVYVTQGELSAGEAVNIGVPLNNCRIYVLDERRKPVMPTARGELYLAGTCLADGYVSRPDLTDAVFVPDPFFEGQKMYKSGDSGRLRSDGVLECFGRLDSQIKINGNRVELDEINLAMLNAGAKQAATVAIRNSDQSTSLYGFVSPESIDIHELKRRIGKTLLPYMIPVQIIKMERLPYNPSGKIDFPALKNMISSQKEPQMHTAPADSNPEAAGGDITPELLIDLWRETLGIEGLRPDVSFFEQGGSSLGALSVLSQYYNRNLIMTMAQFYDNPTAAAQAEFFGCQQKGERPGKKETRLRPKFPSRVPDPVKSADISQMRNILLTGASGYLGAHILYFLLEGPAEKVICPMRDGSRDRLLQTLAWYFGDEWTKKSSEAIEVICGDITKPMLGLDEVSRSRLFSGLDAVFHAAADVRHYTSGTVSADVNIGGTRNVIDMALNAGVPLMHISTASISGEYIKGNVNKRVLYSETDFDIGQNWDENVYIRTKFLAENAVYGAMTEKGLNARVFRVGRLVGRHSDGVFQKNADTNAFYTLVRGIAALGALSETFSGMPVELTPVDLCAKSIIALSGGPLTAYHIVQPESAPLGSLIRSICPEVAIVDDEEFEDMLLRRAAGDEAGELAPLIETCNRFRLTPFTVSVTAEKTHTYLDVRGLKWPEIVPGTVLSGFCRNK